jgi:hypothetical protein
MEACLQDLLAPVAPRLLRLPSVQVYLPFAMLLCPRGDRSLI